MTVEVIQHLIELADWVVGEGLVIWVLGAVVGEELVIWVNDDVLIGLVVCFFLHITLLIAPGLSNTPHPYGGQLTHTVSYGKRLTLFSDGTTTIRIDFIEDRFIINNHVIDNDEVFIILSLWDIGFNEGFNCFLLFWGEG